jgi:hypothetical protein
MPRAPDGISEDSHAAARFIRNNRINTGVRCFHERPASPDVADQ